MAESRLSHLSRLYSILGGLEAKSGGKRVLVGCSGRLTWPRRGVYFFYEGGEERAETGAGSRIVRVGTHALKAGARTSLWGRLSQHKGQESTGGGNHRGSIFRLLVGTALLQQDGHVCPTWGIGSSAPREVRMKEAELERAVSRVIGSMPFLWLGIEDEAGPASQRGFIERNTIALLSNFNKPPLDPPSATWLGSHCDRERVRKSGLWNSNHVEDDCDPAFLDELERLVSRVGSAA